MWSELKVLQSFVLLYGYEIWVKQDIIVSTVSTSIVLVEEDYGFNEPRTKGSHFHCNDFYIGSSKRGALFLDVSMGKGFLVIALFSSETLLVNKQ